MSVAPAVATGVGPRAYPLYAASCVIAAMAALPLLVTPVAPLQDWPNHLTRVHILDEMLRGVGPWTAYYELNSFLLPNIALDLGILGMLRLGLSLDLAGTVFLLATYALFASGFVRLSAALHANDAVKPLLGAALFYNAALFWGFVNYVVGLGALLWVVALWIGATRTGTRLTVAVLGSAATFYCHLIPAVLVVGVLGLLDLLGLFRAGLPLGRHTLRHCTSLAAAAIVLALYKLSPAGGDQLAAISYPAVTSAADFLRWKAMLFPTSFLRGGTWADASLAVFGLILVTTALWAARVRMALQPLLVVIALTVLTLVAPYTIGQGTHLDDRLAVVPVVIAACAVRLRWRRPSGPAAVLAAASALVLVRSAALTATWKDAGRTFATIEVALAGLPPGGVLLTGRGIPYSQLESRDFWGPPMSNVSVLASRHGQFAPSVFAYPTQQPIVLDARFREFADALNLGTPERLERGLARARAMCPGGTATTTFPSVWIAVFFPKPFMHPPRFTPVVRNYALLDACAAP